MRKLHESLYTVVHDVLFCLLKHIYNAFNDLSPVKMEHNRTLMSDFVKLTTLMW